MRHTIRMETHLLYPGRKRNVTIFFHIFTVSSSGMQLPVQQKCVIITAINIELTLNVKCRLIKKKDHKAVKLCLSQKTEVKAISPMRCLSWRRTRPVASSLA